MLVLLIALFTLAPPLFGADGEPPPPRETGRNWLFLTPEEFTPAELERRLEEGAAQLTPRARARRVRTLGYPGVRLSDLPPSRERIEAVRATGCEVVRAVRYLNALVIKGNPRAISLAARLSFVRSSRPVMSFAAGGRSFEPEITVAKPRGALPADAADYGMAYRQTSLVNIPAAHSAGFRGRGVLIGVQDTGFDNLDHICYGSLDVVAAWDFLNNDPDVADGNDRGDGSHGTKTLSVIAGLDSGVYIGAAPDARFVLTKTENSDSETPVEEDYWVAGLWFHDSLGVDVFSSSLSYRDWYDYSDYDGETAVTTRAADSAAAAGLIMVNSMGNTGGALYPRTKMGAPADARMVIAVGGVTRDSSYWATASQGPTYDGRIKPDVAALSSGVYAASSIADDVYTLHTGTSFACPMVAGLAALVVQAWPEATPADMMDILRRTSSRSDSPDTLTGYGVPDALAAIRLAQAMTSKPELLIPDDLPLILFPNPTNGRATALLPNRRFDGRLTLFDGKGRLVGSFPLPAGSGEVSVDLSGCPAGVYYFDAAGGIARLMLVK